MIYDEIQSYIYITQKSLDRLLLLHVLILVQLCRIGRPKLCINSFSTKNVHFQLQQTDELFLLKHIWSLGLDTLRIKNIRMHLLCMIW